MTQKSRGPIFFQILLLLLGLVSTALAVDYENYIAVLMGITLIFFGSLFMYVAPNIFVSKTILNVVTQDFLDFTENILDVTGFNEGIPYYISPNTVWGLKNCVLFISKKKNVEIPSDEILSSKLIDPEIGLIFDAPGSKLSALYEESLGILFSSVNLDYLKENLRKLIVEELELAKNIQLDYEFSKITITVNNSVFLDIVDEKKLTIVDPLTSSLLCTVAKISRMPVILESIEKNDRDKVIQISLRILD